MIHPAQWPTCEAAVCKAVHAGSTPAPSALIRDNPTAAPRVLVIGLAQLPAQAPRAMAVHTRAPFNPSPMPLGSSTLRVAIRRSAAISASMSSQVL